MTRSLPHLLGRVAEFVFDVCDDLATRTLVAWETDTAPPSSGIDIDEACRQALAASEIPLAGVGVVFAPGALRDREYWLRWWQPTPDGPQVLRIQIDAGALDFRDYTVLPWYAVPAATGLRHVTGPYVDYVCTDCYTLTFTCPVAVGGRFLGVAGVDVLVHDLETYVLARGGGVRSDGAAGDDVEWVAVTDAGRVVTAGDSDLTTGDLLLPDEIAGGAWGITPCPGLPWRILSRQLGRGTGTPHRKPPLRA